MTKLQKASEISAIVQNIAVVISLIVGGYWAIKTYIFQNPAFHEHGHQVVGLETESINGKMRIDMLNEEERLYEIELSIANLSKTHNQVLNYGRIKLFYRLVGTQENHEIEFNSILHANEAMWIPREQSRNIKFLVRFPGPGTYIIETNLCKQFLTDCIFQKYVHING